jgi:hypothetical protein
LSSKRINTFHISLEPKQALQKHSTINRENKKFDVEVDDTFRINFISLKGKNGSIELKDNQVWFQFRKMRVAILSFINK